MIDDKKYIRLSKAARELNIGISVIVSTLAYCGINIDPNPNTKITSEQFEILCNQLNSKNQNDNNPAKKETSSALEVQVNLQVSHVTDRDTLSQESKSSIIINDLIKNNLWTFGRITFYNQERGFGFIECFDIDKEVFIHISKIITKPIDDKDFVVFKIEPSKKNIGSYVAYELYLLSKFKIQPQLLQELYYKYQKEDFRLQVLKSLSENQLLEICEKELKRLNNIESDLDFKEVKEVIKFINKGIENEELRKLFQARIEKIVNENCPPVLRVKFWIEGIIEIMPDEENLFKLFIESSEEQQLEIFKKADSLLKIELLKKILDRNNPKRLLEFIISHLHRINNIGYYIDIKPYLFNEKYWKDKKDYSLYLETIDYLNINLEKIDLIRLFTEGYLNEVPVEDIKTNLAFLSREDISKILELPSISKIEAYKIISATAEKEIDHYNSEENIPDQGFAYHATDEEWEKLYEKRSDPFCWLMKIAKELLTGSKFGIVENTIITKTAPWIQLLLWEKRLSNIFPEQAIADHLLCKTEVQLKIEEWLKDELVSKEKIIEILLSNIINLKDIQNRQNFYSLYNHLIALNKLEIDIKNIESSISKNNIWFLKLALWIGDFSSEFDYEEFSIKLPFLSPEHQILFLRKLFSLAHNKKIDLTVKKLNELIRVDFDIFKLNAEYNPEIPLDISVDIVIEAIKSYSEVGKSLLDSDLLKIVLKDVTNNKKHKFQIAELFEKCEGRYEAKYNWDTKGEINKIPFGDGQFYFAIQFETGEMREVRGRHIWGYQQFVPSPYFEELKEKVKQLPGRKWNPEKQHWGVPSRYKTEVLQFAQENRFFLNEGGSKYANNKHLADFKRTETPTGITYCEGRLSNLKDKIFGREFWWCSNHPCYSNCESVHPLEEWERYTLLDFLLILGFNLDDGNRVGEYIERGKYYQFISAINRFNRLLKRMYCEECDNILYPIEDSNYAHYRVTRFNCENEKCLEYKKEIYLHHCLNGKCNGIIDSRKSQKCPNGLYICDSQECGCCCSHDMLNRRLENLRSTGGYIHHNLKEVVENLGGHLERAMHYCYQCGTLMLELPNDVFRCNSCDIQYDVSKNMFKRPHRHLTKVAPSQTGNQGIIDENDIGLSF